MTGTGADLLREQLLAARDELERGEGEALEVAMLAGMLARVQPDDESLRGLSIVVDDAQLRAAAFEAADVVLEVDEDDDPAESWDALSSLDEVCAAATWLGRPARVDPAVDEVVGVLRAFPQAWRAHAPAATEVLRSQRPAQSDPARRLWASVEASAWRTDDADDDAEAPLAIKERLGIPIVIDLVPFFARQHRLAAADELPEEPPWKTLAREAGWELALTVDDDERPALLFVGEEPATFELEGAVQKARKIPEGLSCEVRAGAWRVRVGSREITFTVAG